MMATDFQKQLEEMKEEGLVDAEQISKGARVPRELKRSWLMMIDRLGQGQFGEVWKGLLKETGETAYANALETIVAAKTVCSRKRAVILFGWAFFLISLGSPHVRCTPMGRTCGDQTKSN